MSIKLTFLHAQRAKSLWYPHVCGDVAPDASQHRADHRVTPTPTGTSHLVLSPMTSKTGFTATRVGTSQSPSTSFPPCVGTSERVLLRHAHRSVHPHVRGDVATIAIDGALISGSPPRPWGRRTPRSQGPASRAVHPHMRGDGEAADGLVRGVAGSPARAWGTVPTIAPRSALPDGLPPRAWGIALPSRSVRPSPPAHPHVRGDWSKKSSGMVPPVGSPPRAWGLRVAPNRSVGEIIGSPPRAWGLRTWIGTGTGAVDGSPPRAWGLREERGAHLERRRLTPTCVGTAMPAALSSAGSAGSPPRAWGLHP